MSILFINTDKKVSITERRDPELIPVLGSQPAGDVSHKPGGRLPLLSARPAVTLATLSTQIQCSKNSKEQNCVDWTERLKKHLQLQ